MAHHPKFVGPAPPQEGEVVMFCEHADVGPDHIHLGVEASPFHWFICTDGNGGPDEALTPDGSNVQFRWTALCRDCYSLCVGKRLAVSLVRNHAVWIGDSPIIHPDAENN